MKSRQEIKAIAREAMGEQRGTAILLGLMVILVGGASGVLDMLVMEAFGTGLMYWVVYWAGMAVIYVMSVNMIGEYIKIYNRERADVGAMFSGLAVNFFRKLGGTLWMSLFIYLWSLLLIIPGIVKACHYYFTQNILADCPNVLATDAIKISMRITQGRRWEVFVFVLSFLGWAILSIFTLGILWVVYVGPYFYTADAGFYIEMRDAALAEGRITRQDLGWPPEPPQDTNNRGNSGSGSSTRSDNSGWDDYLRKN